MPDLTNKPFLKTIRELLTHGIQMIDNDQCDEAKAMSMVARYNEETKGYYSKNSFVNYDKAMRIMGIKNRNEFKAVCDANNVTQKMLNNQKVGFLRSEIESLSERLRNAQKLKEGIE